MDFFWVAREGEDIKCRFCGGQDGDGNFFWDCTFSPVVQVRELPAFMRLVARDHSKWPPCLFGHGWLPGLGVGGSSLCVD